MPYLNDSFLFILRTLALPNPYHVEVVLLRVSGWRDSNPRLSAPKADGLPNCPTPRYGAPSWT